MCASKWRYPSKVPKHSCHICAQDQTPQVLCESSDTSGHIFAYAHCCVGLSAGRLAHPGHGARTCWPGCKAFCDIYVVVRKGLAYAGHEPEAFLGFICGFACKWCKYDSKHSCNIFARGLSAFRGIFLGYLCSSFQNVICVKVSTRKPTQNCTDQKLTFVVLGHVAYLYFCVRTFCVNIS